MLRITGEGLTLTGSAHGEAGNLELNAVDGGAGHGVGVGGTERILADRREGSGSEGKALCFGVAPVTVTGTDPPLKIGGEVC